MAKKPKGFVLGDHQFLHPSVNGPLSRLDAPKRQIKGAPPPTYLEGIVRESTPASPAAKELFKGKFCGHGEPTMTVYDIVVDGVEELEIAAIGDKQVDEEGRNVVLLAVRKPDGQWIALFRREWEDALASLVEVRSTKVRPVEVKRFAEARLKGRVSVGFEYPCDADSRDAVSWLTIDALESGKRKPICLVNAELA